LLKQTILTTDGTIRLAVNVHVFCVYRETARTVS